jgi:predicted branched-subunit amino acid permease
VNLRFVIFSAQWRPYLIHYPLTTRLRWAYLTADLNTAFFMRRFPDPRPSPEQAPYFWGGTLLTCVAWHVPALVGLLLASSVPVHWGFAFAGTLALLGVSLSLLTDRPTAMAGAVAGCAAVAAYALPYKLNVVVAIAAAVAMALVMNRFKAQPVQPGGQP